MRLNKIKDWHWRILSKKDITLFEFIIGLKRHLGLKIISYNYNEYPLLSIDFFIISLFIAIPFFKNKNQDRIYGIWFYDNNEKHWLPDFLRISFGKHHKEYDLPWHIKLFNREYETKKIKSLKIKNINNLKTKDSFKYEKIVKLNDNIINVKYYKEIYIFKYRILKWFINKWSRKYYYFNIEYIENDKYLINDIMIFYENKPIEEMFEEYCKNHKIEIL